MQKMGSGDALDTFLVVIYNLSFPYPITYGHRDITKTLSMRNAELHPEGKHKRERII